MKVTNSLFLLATWLLLASCERTECCTNPEMVLEGIFRHTIPNPEINCIEWLEFVSKSDVNIVYGGSDIAHRFTYTKGTDFISLQGPATSSFKPIFTIKDNTTLERIDNGDLWIKEES